MKYLAVAFIILFPILAYSESLPIAIHTGNCGGFRGGCRGYIVNRDGKILLTKFGYSYKNESTLICENKQLADLLFKKLKEIEFTKIYMNERANIHSFISLEFEGSKHEVTWWRRDETTKVLTDFVETERNLLESNNCKDGG